MKKSFSKKIILPIGSVNWNTMNLKVNFLQEREVQLGEWRKIDKTLTYNLKCT